MVEVKICGVTKPEEARWIAQLGADAVGINFHPASSRYVNPSLARDIVQACAPARAVGVFVDLPEQEIRKIVETTGLHVVQLHGCEKPDLINKLGPRLVWKAFRVRGPESIAEIASFLNECRALGRLPERILLDAFRASAAGGTGETWDWDLMGEANLGADWMLAGGLTPENVGDALRRVRPTGVDVASGVESSPGRKDYDKVAAFISAVRE